MAINDIRFTIKLNKGSIKDIESKIGGRLGKIVANKVATRLIPGVRRYALEAENALKSKVPYDTGELRNDFIITEPRAGGYEYRVGIASGLHIGRDRKSKSAAIVARLLNLGGEGGRWKRSSYSKPAGKYSAIGPGQPTKNWVSMSIDQFKVNRGKFLG